MALLGSGAGIYRPRWLPWATVDRDTPAADLYTCSSLGSRTLSCDCAAVRRESSAGSEVPHTTPAVRGAGSRRLLTARLLQHTACGGATPAGTPGGVSPCHPGARPAEVSCQAGVSTSQHTGPSQLRAAAAGRDPLSLCPSRACRPQSDPR